MSDLPPRWTWTTLGEVAESVKNGIFVSRPGTEPNGVPILRISAVRPGQLHLDDIRYTGLDATELSGSGSLLHEGDLLFTRYNGNIDYVGGCAVVPAHVPPLTYPDKLIRVRLHAGAVIPQYVSYAFESSSVRSVVRALARTTAGQVGISGSSLRNVQIPMAPRPEQERIVAALEDHLSRLDAAQRSLGEARKRLQALQTTLIDGLFSEAFPRRELGTLLREPLRNGHSARASDSANGVRTLTLSAVTLGRFTDQYTKITSADPDRVRDLWLEHGDILIERSNTPELVGTTALYTGKPEWAIFPDLLIRIRASDEILPEYLQLVLSSRSLRQYFRASAKGLAGSMPKIDQSTIMHAQVPVPSIDEQRDLLRVTQLRLEGVSRALAQIDRSSLMARNLRASLLTTAFAGRLVAQDPREEPARRILERIRRAPAPRPVRATGRPAGISGRVAAPAHLNAATGPTQVQEGTLW